MKTKRIGSKMAAVRMLAGLSATGIAVIDAARRVGPHGSLCYGYQTVRRAVKAGIVRYGPPLPGRRGASLIAV